jgi:hypothetical protein
MPNCLLFYLDHRLDLRCVVTNDRLYVSFRSNAHVKLALSLTSECQRGAGTRRMRRYVATNTMAMH